MEATLAQKAISYALSGQWEEAVKANLDLLKDNSDDIDALNRLARAYVELGKVAEAKRTALKVLKIDPSNPIAQKSLEKWKNGNTSEASTAPYAPVDSFLEVPGKTKLVPLINLGDEKFFTNLDPGEEVKLFATSHKVSVVTHDGKYLGRLPDDLSARLGNLMKGGHKYQVIIKAVSPKELTVFIRETSRGKSQADTASFSQEKIDYVSFTPPELVHKETPEMTDSAEEPVEEI